MRKLIIILAVFVLLFVAVLVWGVARDRDPPKPGEDINCNGLPQKVKIENGVPVTGDDGKPETVVDTDRLDDWKDLCVGNRGKGAEGFAKGVKLKPSSVSINSGETKTWSVPPGKGDAAQQVKLTLTTGTLARIYAPKPSDDAEDDQKLCLCAGNPLMEDVRRECTSDWISENVSNPGAKRGRCQEQAARTKVFFSRFGGEITIEAIGSPVEVSSSR